MNGRDEIPLIRLGGGLQTFRPNIWDIWDRCGASLYTDEQAAVASLWRALVIRRLEAAELAATKVWRSRELIRTGRTRTKQFMR